MSARNLRLWPVKWTSLALQIKCGWWCWGSQGQRAVLRNCVGSLPAEVEGTVVFKQAVICLPKMAPLVTKSPPSERVGKIKIVFLLLLKRARLALFGICILTPYNPKRIPVLWISFLLWLVCVEHHGTYSLVLVLDKVMKLGLTALTSWPAMVSGSEGASWLNECLLCFFWYAFVYLMYIESS